MLGKFEYKRHATIESVTAELWGIKESELKDMVINTVDTEGNEGEMSFMEEKEGIEKMGVHGFINESTIHYWIGGNATFEVLLHFFAHEMGHGTGVQLDDLVQEELRAEEFADVTKTAFLKATEFIKPKVW